MKFSLLLASLSVIAMASYPALAEECKIKEGAKKVGSAVMWAPKKIGSATVKGVKAVGRGAKKAVGKG